MKYKFDKSETIIWFVIFLVTLTIFIFSLFLYNLDKMIYSVILLSLVSGSFLSYYIANKHRITKFNLLCKEIKQCEINVKYEELFIKIKQKRYQTKPLKQSMNVKIDIPLYSTKAFSVRTTDIFIVFFAIKEFGFFKKYIKPVVFKKANTVVFNFVKDVDLVEKGCETEIHNNELLIRFKNKVEYVEHIIIPAKPYFLVFFD